MEKINVAELLKDCPKDMELDCTLFENVFFDGIDTEAKKFTILLYRKHNNIKNGFSVTKFGMYSMSPDAKCIIFPKGKTTWEGFVPPREFKNGDIVALGSKDCAQLFIFKEYIHHDYAKCYMMLDSDGDIDFKIKDYHVARLATEEEKQKLFDAIKANGYKWNAETKTLEKLVEPKFKVGERIRRKNRDEVCLVSEVCDNHYLLDEKDIYLPFFEQDKWESVSNKFDITTLKPFEKVLVRQNDYGKWGVDFFGFYDERYCRTTGSCVYTQCIPYEGNEHLLGKTDACDEYYKIWGN